MAEDVQTTVARHDAELAEHERRINSLEKGQNIINSLALDIAKVSSKLDFLVEKVDKIDNKVEDIEQKPGKRWDGMITAIISACIGIIIGWILLGR